MPGFHPSVRSPRRKGWQPPVFCADRTEAWAGSSVTESDRMKRQHIRTLVEMIIFKEGPQNSLFCLCIFGHPAWQCGINLVPRKWSEVMECRFLAGEWRWNRAIILGGWPFPGDSPRPRDGADTWQANCALKPPKTQPKVNACYVEAQRLIAHRNSRKFHLLLRSYKPKKNENYQPRQWPAFEVVLVSIHKYDF